MRIFYQDKYLGRLRPAGRGVDFLDMSPADALAFKCHFDRTWFQSEWHTVEDKDVRKYLCGLFKEFNCGIYYRAEWDTEDTLWNSCYFPKEKIITKNLKGEPVMSDELITKENLSIEFLKSVLESAFINVELDEDGDIMVRERCNCFVLPDKERGRILLLTIFNLPEDSSEEERIRCANTINCNYSVIRAFVLKDTMRFAYDMMLDGGMSRKAFVQQLRRFCAIPHEAVAEYGKDIVS